MAYSVWTEVRQLTGRQQEAGVVAGITAESLKEHYAAISTDSSYTPPLLKHSAATATSSQPEYMYIHHVYFRQHGPREIIHLQTQAKLKTYTHIHTI